MCASFNIFASHIIPSFRLVVVGCRECPDCLKCMLVNNTKLILTLQMDVLCVHGSVYEFFYIWSFVWLLGIWVLDGFVQFSGLVFYFVFLGVPIFKWHSFIILV
jgi:hypothetical protein